MIELHPAVLTKNGKKEFAVLPYEEFVAVQELLEDFDDLVSLRAAKQVEADEPTTPLSQVKQDLGI